MADKKTINQVNLKGEIYELRDDSKLSKNGGELNGSLTVGGDFIVVPDKNATFNGDVQCNYKLTAVDISGSTITSGSSVKLAGGMLELGVVNDNGYRLTSGGSKVLLEGEAVSLESVENYLEDNSEEVDLTNYFTKDDVSALFNSIFEFDDTTLIIKDN